MHVFEQDQQVGGLAKTLVRDGFRFDIGGHRWFTKKDELNHFLIDLLGEELGLTDRISRIYFDGKFVEYPLKIGDALTRIGPATGIRALSDFAVSKISQRLKPRAVVSMEDAYVAQFGRTLYELFFRNYSEKVWGMNCTDLSGDWVTQRSKGLSLLTTVREAVKRSDTQVESLVERFMYPRLGFGRISERMAEEIEAGGGSVQLGRRVVAAHHDGEKLEAITVSDGSREEVVTGDAFISSIPMTELVQILRPAVNAPVCDAARSLTYRDLITVNLMLDRQQVSPDTWLYIHDPAISFARLHEPRNWSPDMAPEGKTSLVLEIFCERTDEIWQRSDASLCELVANDLADKLHFIDAREVMDGFALRSVDAYPRYNIGYRGAVDAIKQQLRSFANLEIVGRGGTFRYNNSDHSIETGLLAARGILGEAVDVDSVNAAQEYLEERRLSPMPAEMPSA